MRVKITRDKFFFYKYYFYNGRFEIGKLEIKHINCPIPNIYKKTNTYTNKFIQEWNWTIHSNPEPLTHVRKTHTLGVNSSDDSDPTPKMQTSIPEPFIVVIKVTYQVWNRQTQPQKCRPAMSAIHSCGKIHTTCVKPSDPTRKLQASIPELFTVMKKITPSYETVRLKYENANSQTSTPKVFTIVKKLTPHVWNCQILPWKCKPPIQSQEQKCKFSIQNRWQ